MTEHIAPPPCLVYAARHVAVTQRDAARRIAVAQREPQNQGYPGPPVAWPRGEGMWTSTTGCAPLAVNAAGQHPGV